MGENEELDLELLCKAMVMLLSYQGEETIVHCDFGNNRSRLVCEFSTFAKTGRWINDETSVGLGGCPNKTEYNIKNGNLPDIKVIEQKIKQCWIV